MVNTLHKPFLDSLVRNTHISIPLEIILQGSDNTPPGPAAGLMPFYSLSKYAHITARLLVSHPHCA